MPMCLSKWEWQHKLMVGSMNGTSKFTKGEGGERQLGGTIYTKNLKHGMKMPAKIVEGRTTGCWWRETLPMRRRMLGRTATRILTTVMRWTTSSCLVTFLWVLSDISIGGELVIQLLSRSSKGSMWNYRPEKLTLGKKNNIICCFISVNFLSNWKRSCLMWGVIHKTTLCWNIPQ